MDACGITIPLSQNTCTRPRGHSGACRCSAGDVDDREARRGEYAPRKIEWPSQWRGRGEPSMPIVMVTTRDEEGVDYEVRVTQAGVRAYEEGEGEITVWSTRRDFGQRTETLAGGPAFQYAAHEQQSIADEWANAILRAAEAL